MKSNRERAMLLLEKLTNEDGLSSHMLLEYLINDYMEGSDAYDALLAAEEEFFGNDEFEEEEEETKYKFKDEN